MSDTRRRVKVYTLNEDRQWDDRGTGHVSSTFVERQKGISLLVRAESDGKFVLVAVVRRSSAWCLQHLQPLVAECGPALTQPSGLVGRKRQGFSELTLASHYTIALI